MPVLKKAPPPIERVRELVAYCPETGVLSWAKARRGCRKGGQAGCVKASGHRYVCLDDVDYSVARVAWYLMTGQWPIEVDHRDGDASNDRWANLRECTHQQNIFNRRRAKHNKSGRKGVTLHQGKWRARIVIDRKRVRDESFASLDEAHAAYARWTREIHGEYGRAQ